MTTTPSRLIFTGGAVLGGVMTAPLAYQCGKQIGESKGWRDRMEQEERDKQRSVER